MNGFQQYVLLIICFFDCAVCSRPREVTWSNKSFGPDGPWQAVTVSIGSNYSSLVVPSSDIALYPGGSWESEILLSSICDNKTLSSVCYGDKAGLFDSDISVTYDNHSIELPPYGPWADLSWGYTAAIPVYAKATRATDWVIIDGASIPDVDLITLSAAWQTYPNGVHYPLEVGTLSLGSPDINQTFGASIKINTTFVNSYLYDQGGVHSIPSYSYGMHIGSAALGIPGSLYLGGYDQSRVIGDVSAQAFSSGSFPIEMFDIEIGVAEGGSPWDYSNKSGLLAHKNSSLNFGLTVLADPSNPYIYLPQSSCDAIAEQLPVTYQPAYGLYFWNTTSPQFKSIVASPGYLGFKFSKNGLNNEDLTIKVPFSLLNPTLEAPLVKTPVQYFPCMATNSTPALGRAFLQAAFIGVNWLGPEKWYLAQAPGPGGSFIADPVTISDDESVSGSSSSWEETWKSKWTVIPNNSTSNNTSTTDRPSTKDTSNKGMSTITKVSISVGASVGLVIIVATILGLYVCRQRKRQVAMNQETNSIEFDKWSSPAYQSTILEAPDTMTKQLYELNNNSARYEIGSKGHYLYEIGSEKDQAAELGHGDGFPNKIFELPERWSIAKMPKFI
ncbi:hypothetical protein N7478_001182 [Penicillium angulare]|uniref:uncharacterized protein n=1 Tax=Penicillium angulare TaxID=116970 RepID=UPI002541A249|nr:uncharacterized protein N7478_001182 [Penicillium angulare]KAJ5291931.1 hypothetical protein N7478_001182 [Penicillium angulare]